MKRVGFAAAVAAAAAAIEIGRSWLLYLAAAALMSSGWAADWTD